MSNLRNSDGSGGDVAGVWLDQAQTLLTARFDGYGRRRVSTTGAPAVAVGAGAGTGSPAVSVVGTDEHGVLTITAGTSPAAGVLVTVTFNEPFAKAPIVTGLVAGDNNSSGAGLYASATTTVLTISARAAIGGNTKVSYALVAGA